MKKLGPILSVLCLVSLAACVTETVTPTTRRFTGMPVHPGTGSPTNSPTAPVTGLGAVPVLPNGPIAAPATASTTSTSRVEVGVIPLGVVTYDGQSLPLVSPDGRFIAVEEGEPPTWDAILAQPAAVVPTGSKLAVYQIGEHELKSIALPQDLPRGLMLGRASDARGFLVEAPQPDGSRWIGRVAWVGGKLDWLVRGPLVAAHATFTCRGELLYTSRAVESDDANLVIQGPRGDQSVRTPGDGRYAFPMCTQDPDMVYVLHLTDRAMELEAIRLDRGPDAASGDRAPAFGATVARQSVAPKGDMTVAFQMASTVQQAMPLKAGESPRGGTDLAILHPRIGRMTEFRLDSAKFEPLAARSYAAVASSDADRPGYFCATPKGMVFDSTSGRAGAEDAVRVVAGEFVPRRVESQPQSMILFGPVKDRPDQFNVVKLVIGPQAPPPGKDSKG